MRIESDKFSAVIEPNEEGIAEDVSQSLPSSVCFEVLPSSLTDRDILITTETDEFSAPSEPHKLSSLEAGSASFFSLNNTDGTLTAIGGSTDIPASRPDESNQLMLCRSSQSIAASRSGDSSGSPYESTWVVGSIRLTHSTGF